MQEQPKAKQPTCEVNDPDHACEGKTFYNFLQNLQVFFFVRKAMLDCSESSQLLGILGGQGSHQSVHSQNWMMGKSAGTPVSLSLMLTNLNTC